MVKALKGKPFNGYFDVKQGAGRRRFTEENASEFLPTIHKLMAKMILDRIQGEATLVPIPNSAVTSVGDPNFKTRELAQRIAACADGRLICNPLLIFGAAQPSSHSGGGSRDPHHFEAAYHLTGKPTGEIILVDDVLTSGAHLIGAHWKLENADCKISLAATWGRTTGEQLDPVFKIREEELPLARFTADFDDL